MTTRQLARWPLAAQLLAVRSQRTRRARKRLYQLLVSSTTQQRRRCATRQRGGRLPVHAAQHDQPWRTTPHPLRNSAMVSTTQAFCSPVSSG